MPSVDVQEINHEVVIHEDPRNQVITEDGPNVTTTEAITRIVRAMQPGPPGADASAAVYNDTDILVDDTDFAPYSITGENVHEIFLSMIQGFSGTIVSIFDFMNDQAFDKTVDNTDDITEGLNKFVTAAEKTKLSNLSGTNTGDQTASTVPNTPAGNITATTMQAAIDELDSEKVAKSGDTMTGRLVVSRSSSITVGTESTYAASFSNGTGGLALGSDANATYIQSFGSRPLRINPAGNNTEITSGNLGVGVVGPSYKLHIAGTIAPSVDSTYNLGATSLFWSSIYTDNVYLGNTDLQISGSGTQINLGKYSSATGANKTQTPTPASVLGMNSTAYAYGIGAFAGMYDYLYCADRNPNITATSNYGTVANLFDGDLANTLNIPIANLAATPWVLTVTHNTSDWGFSDTLKLLFTGHRLYSSSGTLTDWKLETMDAGGIWYTEVERTGVSDAINLLAPNLHRTDQSPVYTDGASWHRVKAIRLTVTGGTTSGHSAGNITISGMQLRNTRPSFSAADGIGALDTRGGSVYGSIGLYTPSPTHTITLANTTTGITHYNTADQTTNYERVRQYWSSNVFKIDVEKNATGTNRDLSMSANGTTMQLGGNASGGVTISRHGTSLDLLRITSSSMAHTSAVQAGLSITPTINQSATGGYAGILLNVTETATGSGSKSLIDLQVASTSRYRVDNLGNVIVASAATSGIALYNTADQTTNYERVRQYWNSNEYLIYGSTGGTGTARPIILSALGSGTQALALNATSASGLVESRGTSGAASAIIHRISGTLSSSSGVQYGLSIAPTINQSATAGYTALLVNTTETALGSGALNLIDLQIGGTSRFKVSSPGILTITAAQGSASNRPVVTDHVQTVSNKRITRRVVTVAQSATPSINTDITDVASITSLAQAITSVGVSGTPVDGDLLMVRITDDGSARAISWGGSFEASTVALPTTTVASTMLVVGFMWNTATTKWRCIASA